MEAARDKGQPTKYKPEYCQAIIDWFNVDPWEVVDIPHESKHPVMVEDPDGDMIATSSILYVEHQRVYKRKPSVIGFAKSISVCTKTVYNWIDPSHDSYQEDFLRAFEEAKEFEKAWLNDVGMSGVGSAAYVKFLAVNCTDMADKSELDHNVSSITDILAIMSGSKNGSNSAKTDA